MLGRAQFCTAAVLLALLARVSPLAAAAAEHPLDPLSEDEITRAAALVRGFPGAPANPLFAQLALAEPTKAEVLAFRPGKPFRRDAHVIVFERKPNRAHEALVDLRKGAVRWLRALPQGAQPPVLMSEYELVPRIVKSDPRWREAMRKRGITDPDKVWVDTWAAGTTAPAGMRLLRALSYLQDGSTNFYSRPIEGVTALVDANAERVLELVDTGAVPISLAKAELDERALGRRALKPLEVSQPEGASFEVNGQRLTWQGWSFRWAMHPREGLVIYEVSHQDGKVLRPVMYRGSLSEMVVPYGDPDTHWVWRNAFDEGEYGIGRLASPLEPAQDAPKNALFFDVPFADDTGKAYTLPRAVAVFERDAGILWKHYDIDRANNQTRRARELVLFFVATIGNYVRDNEALDGQDVVVWYTMGITHVPRPEEWPVMPVHTLSFELAPAGFFAQNPGLDVPRVR